ncbi:MAG: hypothetical protein IPM17_17120 [Verrucomicrobia bacterium]|jgi:hypothetical protein|nr:hypothetical protein [Verrucomicrobiota bacterium]
MPQNAAKELHVPVSGLIGLQQKLVAGLTAYGVSGAELSELFGRDVTAICVKCGMTVSGDELATVALAASAEALSEPKLARLRQGYCGRNGCDSNYYTVRLAANSKVDWDRVLLGPAEPTPEPETAPPGEQELAAGAASERAQRRRWWRVGVGVAALLILLVIRHVMEGGRIPLLQPKMEYRTGAPVQVE